MGSEMSFVCAPIIALIAGEWSLVGMDSLVRNEITALGRPVITLIASVWPLTGMNALVKVRVPSVAH